MRVVSGTCKGRPLKAVPGTGTRPTTDKVKEAIFNMIGPYFDGGSALDLFGGSGGLGIEALSRGTESCIFVDKDQKAIQTIHKNIEACGFEKQSEVYRNDAERALKAVMKRELSFSLIFLDPPYKQQKLKALINSIGEAGILDEKGYIVAEHGTEESLPDELGELVKLKGELYGTTAVSIFGYSLKGE
ncbi:16S rRNA (guanine(966)-N(2))-methyltransferase RsmD [Metabacillus sp. GX 13764]|uniref:16S rRNA (guanine(966)-N(2))-methyltransferase RsmD n=1 Tax=Metabacillus kandeliae TaxID=2900151 RepID=UPI001E362304|nr:16S rRNA (guanine(966)-N(2))-methyltransferase RsmD [Metabacillus kandeliae]MCD7033916.1 16S rRNA (guanine(966)-N(2))-methyltransferase RsmD [Metabacillus kandeliae]